MTKISVVMPVYNAAAFLRQAVQSVLEQTHGCLELICIDDKSTDGSLALLRELAAGDARVTVVEHTVNQGVGRTRTAGLQQAQGTYLLFVDADDYVEPKLIENCLARAETTDADIVLFKHDLIANPTLEYDVVPTNLSDRACFGLWDETFNYRVIPQSIFQLGANLQGAFLRTDFVRGAQLDFGAYRVGDSLCFLNRALLLAEKIALLGAVLYHVRWWHGGNLTQVTLGDPRRYYQAFLDLRHRLEDLDDFESIEWSYVNYVADSVVRELKAQGDFDTYTAAAEFYRVSGFDALGILGYPEAYFSNPETHAALRRVVMGAVYGRREQFVRDLETENQSLVLENEGLAHANRQLTEWLTQWRTFDRKLLKRFANKMSKSVKSKVSMVVGQGEPKDMSIKSLANLPSNQKMNATTGYRLSRLCSEIKGLEDAVLLAHRQAFAISLSSLRSEVKESTIYGECAISASNKVYVRFLDVLIDLLRRESADVLEIRQGIEALQELQTAHTNKVLKLAFNLEEDQIFPSIESVFTAAAKDPRYDASLVYAPLGQGVESWKNTEAPLYTKDGPLPIKQKSGYRMFQESPDVLFVTRPHINLNGGPLFNGPEDVFEITPVQDSGYRTVYLPYGFFDTISETAISFGYQHAIHPVAWKIVAYSEQILSNFKKYSELEGRNAVLLGAPRFDISSGINGFRSDELTEEYRATINGKRTLLWNPHYTNTGRPAQMFLDYLNSVLRFFKDHEDLVLYWRPHPKLFGHLVISDLLTQRELDGWLADLATYDNIIVDKSKDYINGFALTDAMLTDGDSSLPFEYIATGKPVYLVFLNGYSKQNADARYKNQIPRLYYHYPVEKLDELLEAFASGQDPLKDERLQDAPLFIYDNDGHTGERVLDYMRDALFAAEDELVHEVLYPSVTPLPLPVSSATPKDWIVQEVERVAQRLGELRAPDDLAFVLLTDTYATANGTWGDTSQSIRLFGEKVALDGVIHLGDFTDGRATFDVQRASVGQLLDDLRIGGLPIWPVLGETDSNSIDNNPSPLSLLEQSELFLERKKAHYFVDIKDRHLRLIFLDSYDASHEQPFGYSEDCIAWLRHTLASTPPARRIMVFSHIPPVARLLNGAGKLRGEAELLELLNKDSRRILAFICGHNHADNLDNGKSVPIAELASANYRARVESEPDGGMVPKRVPDSASQECWDVLLVNPVEDSVRFVRFGAGDDRVIEDGTARWA